MRRWAALSVLVAIGSLAGAQMRVAPLDLDQGHVGLGLALRRLANTGVFMHATAHPDDEDNALLVLLNRGLGYRTALATATRGNGGQNEIGPELFEALGVLRTEELAAMHRFDGAEQYFTRAVDFGNSFSIEETFEKWGRDEITGDFVRLIRTIRPDVMLALRPDGTGSGQHHEASSVIAREAFKLAGDPTKYPEQIEEGLRPWQPRKFYIPAGGRGTPPQPGSRALTLNLAAYDRLLGRTYEEIGTEARSMHKCQGMAQLLALPGPSTSSVLLVETTLAGGVERVDRDLFDGVDRTIGGLAQFAGGRPPRELTNGLAAIAGAVQEAQKRFDASADESTLQPLLTGLRVTRELRAALRALPIPDAGRFEIDFRLRQKEREFQQALLLAARVRLDALADDGVVVPGQPVRVSLTVANRGSASVTISDVNFDGFTGEATCTLTPVVAGGGRGRGATPPPPPGAAVSALGRDQAVRCQPTLTVPADARINEPYWHREGTAGRYVFDDDAPFGLPFRPTPFYVQTTMVFPGSTEEVFGGVPVQYRYEGNVFTGEKRSALLVVPALSVRVAPEIVIVPAAADATAGKPASSSSGRGAKPPAAPAGRGRGRAGAAPAAATPGRAAASGASRDIRVTIVNDSKGAIESEVTLETPEGWTVVPPQQAIAFTREDEARTVRFEIRAPAAAPPGEHRVGARATAGDQTFTRGFEVIEYPHITRRHIFHEAAARVKTMEVRTASDLTVGYIMGVGDEVPAAIEQLGVRVELLDEDDLAWGDLSRYPTIVTGVRAYERRADLRAHNSRLLDYVRAGGTLIVQYNKVDEFNEAQYGPYPAKVTSDRVTDEHAPVQILVPDHPLFNTPNRITEAAWQGWIQERGLYFLGEHDSRYRDLVELEDSFPNNPGVKRGALAVAQYGKGRWVYVGLGLWRELPAGVDGAYYLLANLISLR
jgi:LmbE family N-acetylglucosaminyl deacetylase